MRGEVARLGATGAVTETVCFGASELTYTLQTTRATSEVFVEFVNGQITINLPHALARSWVESGEVGIYVEQQISADKRLQITLEKDFVCLDRAGDADNADAYPHPH